MKGPHGHYWLIMHKNEYWNVPGVWEALTGDVRKEGNAKVIMETVRLATQEAFDVNTRADISPEQVEEFALRNGLEGLVTFSRNAEMIAKERYGYREDG